MGLVSRHMVEYHRIGPVHIYEVALYTREGELARMNWGEYCAETRVLIVAPDHALLVVDNDAQDTSHEIPRTELEALGFDAQYPGHEHTIKAVAEAIAKDAEAEWADTMCETGA